MELSVYRLSEEDRELLEDGEERIESEELTRRKIGRWLNATSFVQFRNEIRKSVIGQDTLDMVLFSIYCYLERVSRGLSVADSILLTAPSGCGKTETYRSVKRYFERELPFLPCYQIDVSQLTETGFKGADPIYVVGGLLAAPETNGIGLVWLDEIDKKVLPSYESRGGNVNAKVQYGLLTILEGSICPPRKESCAICVDTNNTLFIGLGAFDYVRNNRKQEAVEIGFGKEQSKTDHYDVITREDLIDAGACYEFVGRFSSIFSYHKLSEDSLRKIIQLIVKEESDVMGIEIKTEESFIQEVVKINNSRFGCRLVRSLIREKTLKQYMKLKEHRYSGKNYRIILTGEDGFLERKTEKEKNESEECTEI